jgi:uncharacterized protein
MNPAPARLILFTRYPEAGTTKTRLIPVLGPDGAAAFQRRLTERAAETAGELRRRHRLSVEVRYEGGSESHMRRWLGPEFTYRPQGRGHIGARMRESLLAAFQEGAPAAVIIGSDIPGITPAILGQAFDALGRHPLVFGPATDGGYYLIGSTAAGFADGAPFLGNGVAWGTPQVLAQTLDQVRDQGLSYVCLETLCDADRPEDLQAAMEALSWNGGGPGVSVVIPALNEAGQIAETVCGLASNHRTEVIVVDGGSTDATAHIAASLQARILVAQPPRSVQMNAGAAIARGSALVFLHADTCLSPGFEDQVQETLARPGVAAGAFRLRISAGAKGLRLIEGMANWRSRCLQLPYGDQAIFLNRDTFWGLHGFPPFPIMEDFELIRRLRRRGRIELAPGQASTSARRWLQVGIARTWLINQLVITGYFLGVPADRLARWYRFKKA